MKNGKNKNKELVFRQDIEDCIYMHSHVLPPVKPAFKSRQPQIRILSIHFNNFETRLLYFCFVSDAESSTSFYLRLQQKDA